jgi:hypothetical protein
VESILKGLPTTKSSGTGRYILFGRNGWDSVGGMSDFLFSFFKKKDCLDGMDSLRRDKYQPFYGDLFDYYQILDTETRLYTDFNISESELIRWLKEGSEDE